MPHAAFHGQTPDEIYYGRGDDVPDHLAEARRRARQMRLETNRDLSCEACLTVTAVGPSEAVPPAERSALRRDELPLDEPLWVFDEIHKMRGWTSGLKGV